MVEINWNTFKTKFDNKTKTFEWLCYLLFCKEFNKEFGIFGYKNQAGIETDPIEREGEVIGWQAKFYETNLSQNKDDLISTVDKAKDNHPNLTQIIIYTNKQFGQGKDQNDPQYKVDIDEHADSKGIELIWRTHNYFESPFVCEKNELITKHFFSLDDSIIDFINELRVHTESILRPIKSTIQYNGKDIKIDRTETVKKLQEINKEPVTLLSGEGGVGKTAIIKDLYKDIKEEKPLYIFKAIEFNVPNLNQLFNTFGDFSISDFLTVHSENEEKYIVIDSAEKLSDLKYKDTFKEFLALLLDNKWEIIFTTRNSYLEDLRYQFVEVFNTSFQHLTIQKLNFDKLNEISASFDFSLPKNKRLLDLISNPFYLGEYLKYYKNFLHGVSYSEFKDILWNKQISKSSYRASDRENCFLKIAKKRADSGLFFVQPDSCSSEAIDSLQNDEIIKYDNRTGKYFITHDIYEEWALEKLIERNFYNKTDYKDFFENIGSSLPTRRAFRKWLSEQLRKNRDTVLTLIRNSIEDENLEDFWRDEVLVSVLLSDYSENFVASFEEKLLENNQELLIKVIFLLRVACKEVDDDVISQMGLLGNESIPLQGIFTKPKGNGWKSILRFIKNQKENIGLNHLDIILPLLEDWNKYYKKGEATRYASVTALFYYKKIIAEGGFSYSSSERSFEDRLLHTILNGSHEIKEEIKEIIEETLSDENRNRKNKHFSLVEHILSPIDRSTIIAETLPQEVIRIADSFWFKNSQERNFPYGSSMGIEKHFCLHKFSFDYSPSSAYQTPIYPLLRSAPKDTVDFILHFTNRSIECLANSELTNHLDEVEVHINNTNTIKQYLSSRLWTMYRGLNNSPELLESMHMALEKWLLNLPDLISNEALEKWCIYLIKNSKSGSITAVVTSVVLANPFKLFNVAEILFKTKEFFLYENQRRTSDQNARNFYSIGHGLGFDHRRDFFIEERLNTCDDKHRKRDLESLARRYQFFKIEGDKDDTAKERQDIIWEIFDDYYDQLQSEDEEDTSNKTWRLFLARMDRRKMNPETRQVDEGIAIDFNPELDSDLKEYSEQAQELVRDNFKNTALKLWSNFRFNRNKEKYEKYEKYEESPQLALNEARSILDEHQNSQEDQNDFSLSLDKEIPGYVSAVLIRDFKSELSSEDLNFCKKLITDIASVPLVSERYIHQHANSIEPCINILPEVFEISDSVNKKEIKSTLLLLLLSNLDEVSQISSDAISNKLWDISHRDAQSIFSGYLFLKPLYEKLKSQVRDNNTRTNIRQKPHHISIPEINKQFLKKYDDDINKILNNNIQYSDLGEFDNLEPSVLIKSFELLPQEIKDEQHQKFLKTIFPKLSLIVFKETDNRDYKLKLRFFDKFTSFILLADLDKIEEYLQPFIDNLTFARYTSDFFQSFILNQDRLKQYDNFWKIWEMFYPKIIELCRNRPENFFIDEILHKYLFAISWKKGIKDWHTLKDRDKIFFEKVTEDIGSHTAVFYSIAKLLNDVGSKYLDDGINWISNIISNDKNLLEKKLETNTKYYLEKIARKYIMTHRTDIRTSPNKKKQVIILLNFLISKGSVTGYLLREDII